MSVTPSALEPIFAKLQADVGEFLQLRRRLAVAVDQAQSPGEAAALRQLLAENQDLSARLPDAVRAAQDLSQGVLSFQAASTAGLFYSAMEAHLVRARSMLADLPPGEPSPESAPLDWSTLILYGGGLVAAYWVLRRANRVVMYAVMAGGAWYLWNRWGAAA